MWIGENPGNLLLAVNTDGKLDFEKRGHDPLQGGCFREFSWLRQPGGVLPRPVLVTEGIHVEVLILPTGPHLAEVSTRRDAKA